jgi:hypothetical protein
MDDYWSVDVLGLTQVQAEALVAHANAEFGLFAMTVDPERRYTRHMDFYTVEHLLEMIPLESRIGSGVVEDFQEWLATAKHGPRESAEDS